MITMIKAANTIRLATICCAMALSVPLTGCADNPMRFDRPNLVASPDKTSMMLANAADRASVALETLAAVEQARSPDVSVAPIDNVPIELRRAITVNWVGPVEPIAEKLANRAGYAFQSIGTAPPVPLVVSVDAENMPVIDVLRSLGLQLGVRGDVRVDGRRRMVEIHYSPNTGIGG